MKLNIKQRFFAVFIYFILIIGLGYYFRSNLDFIFNPSDKLHLIFIATAITLLLSAYIIEPFFTKPVEVVARWIAVFLFLIGIQDKNNFLLYNYWLLTSLIFVSTALLVIVTHESSRFEKQLKFITSLICKISRPEVVFSILYFTVVISFFTNETKEFPFLIGFGFLLVINKPVNHLTIWIWKIFKYFQTARPHYKEVGKIIGYNDEDFFKVEINLDKNQIHKSLLGSIVGVRNNNVISVGIVINEKTLVGKKWVQVKMLKDSNENTLSFHLESQESLSGTSTVFTKDDEVLLLESEEIPTEIESILKQSAVLKNYGEIVGYIWSGSTINKIRFYSMIGDELIKSRGIGEGSIIQSRIANEEVLFQIIDARTEEEDLEFKDSHGFKIGTAQKLGKYDFTTNELSTVKWLPNIYEPVYLLKPEEITYEASKFIGRLPKTQYGIPIKNIDELVTHNTAILGILGIGKSYLTFELIQKIITNTEVKIFCVDITNQYSKEIVNYIEPNYIQEDLSDATKNELRTNNPNGTERNPESWGNERLYKGKLDAEFQTFISSEKRIIILNPDWHSVSKAGSAFNIQHKVDLTVAEKTRIISERLFVKAKEIGETTQARFLIIFEEAHSLVPEWNSVANDGDKNATNGTAKVILQGRKYGLGSMVITQRTANISKSILNQCNTIFALRVFDDTGKQFLENYIGSDYSNLLPTLEERHAVVIGKALKLKQPVIIELNDRKFLIKEEIDTNTPNGKILEDDNKPDVGLT